MKPANFSFDPISCFWEILLSCYRAGKQVSDADLTITIDRIDLEQTMMGAVSFDEQISAAKARLEGSRQVYEQLKPMLVHFDLGFEIMPGTGARDLTPSRTSFEQKDPGGTGGG